MKEVAVDARIDLFTMLSGSSATSVIALHKSDKEVENVVSPNSPKIVSISFAASDCT